MMDVRLLVIVCTVLCAKVSAQSKPGVKVSLQLVSFKNPNNKDMNNKCCETLCSTRCDYFFKLCLNHGNDKCVLDITTKRWDKTNDIVFTKGRGQLGNSHSNPLVKELTSWKGTLNVSIDVFDYDRISSHDLVDQYVIAKPVTPKAGIVQQTWTTVTLKGVPSTMNLKYNVQCNRNYYGPSCTTYCLSRDDSTGHYTCDLKTGHKVCRNGWHGKDCLTYCLPQDDDANGHYSCDKITGEKVCHVGWYGNSCKTFCMPRNDSRGGYACDSNGTRMCLTEWYPSNKCDVFCRPRNDSRAGYVCNLTTGGKICLSDWNGPECDCSTRNDSLAGYSCNKTTGDRICHNGWYGNHCNVFCIPRNDSSGHYSCNHDNGAKECLKDWFGRNCDVYCPPKNQTSDQQTKCSVNNTLICARNWYGVNCSVHCEPRDDDEGHYKCNLVNGEKVCLPNWYGRNCTVGCIPRDSDWFGHFDCDVNGDKRCHESWFGRDCKEYCAPQNSSSSGYFRCRHDGARVCLDHWYGPKCLKYCKEDEQRHYECSVEGNRVCLKTWYGQNCSIQCIPRDDAHGHFICDSLTGQEVCLEGWTGLNCKDVVTTEMTPTTSQLPPENRESKKGRPGSALSKLSLALILGGILLLICIIVGVAIIISSRRQTKRPATPFPYLRYDNSSKDGSLDRGKEEQPCDSNDQDAKTNRESGIPNLLSQYDDDVACKQKDIVLNLQEVSWNQDGSRHVDDKLVICNNPLFLERHDAAINPPTVDPRVDPATGLRDNSDWVEIFDSYQFE